MENIKCLPTLKLRFLLRKGHHPQISQLVDCERIFKTGLTLIARETLFPKKRQENFRELNRKMGNVYEKNINRRGNTNG